VADKPMLNPASVPPVHDGRFIPLGTTCLDGVSSGIDAY
jgi:hypothetical protein